MAAWRRKLMNFLKMRLDFKKILMNSNKKEIEELLITKEHLRRIEKFTKLKLMKLNKNVKNLRTEDRL